MPWVNEKEQGIFHPCSYRLVCAIQFNKPANKNQVLFEKNFFLKKSITNKAVFFIWFAKIYFYLFLFRYTEGFWLLNFQPGHEPVELLPGK